MDQKIIDGILKTGTTHLEEFRLLFEDESSVGSGDSAMLQTARLRRARKATCTYYSQVYLDSLLADSELRGLKGQFWVRKKLRFPAQVQLSDAMVSRISRELSKPMLCICDIWKVRSLQFQLGTSQEKRRLADGLYMDEPDTDEVMSPVVDTYLQKLHTRMIAYALNGTQLIPGVDPVREKALGANTSEFVEVPLYCMLAL